MRSIADEGWKRRCEGQKGLEETTKYIISIRGYKGRIREEMDEREGDTAAEGDRMERKMHRERERKVQKEIKRQTDRQTDRQTGGKAQRERERERERKRER